MAENANIDINKLNLPLVEGPGKFEGELAITQFAYLLALNGGCDEELSAEGWGWVGLIRGPISIEADDKMFLDIGRKPTPEEINFLRTTAGVVIETTETGFVYGEWYGDSRKLEETWKAAEESLRQYIADMEQFEESEG